MRLSKALLACRGMKAKLKRLDRQVIVVTAATSGIGLSIARTAAKKGARLVLGFQDDGELRQLRDEIRREGGDAIYVEADAALEADVRRIAEAALERFQGIDTWINTAGAAIHGAVLDMPLKDMKRAIDANLWSAIHGSRIACEYLAKRGGVLINVSSELAGQSALCLAADEAVKIWSDALRAELDGKHLPIAVSLISPAQKSESVTADAILFAASTPVRNMFVGAASKQRVLTGVATLGAGLAFRAWFRGKKVEPRYQRDPS
jgi:NAD(P)-dependent dehydrogenase (short-subunit alcohol dehydrogenase family)